MTNHRHSCAKVLEQHHEQELQFGFEQEYTLLDGDTQRPLKWPEGGYPEPQGEITSPFTLHNVSIRPILSRCRYRRHDRPRSDGRSLSSVSLRWRASDGRKRRSDAGPVGVPAGAEWQIETR